MNPDDGTTPSSNIQPHAFHLNLPPQFKDDNGVPLVTTFALKKASQAFKLAMSIHLEPSFFEMKKAGEESSNTKPMEVSKDEDWECDESEDEEAPVSGTENTESLLSVMKRCSRLISMFSSLESLKFSGFKQHQLMDMTLHFLRLLTATISYHGTGVDRTATIHYDNVGAILHCGEKPFYESQVPGQNIEYTTPTSKEEYDTDMQRDFALPTPCRESLLLLLINILSHKGPLRSVSNTSVYTKGEGNRSLMILHWKPFLRMLLRTAPYLDESSHSNLVKDSNSRTNTIIKRTVQLIRDARHFFEQGVRPEGHEKPDLVDHTSKAIWEMVEADVLHGSASNACFRGTIMLYLFFPARSSEDFYLSILPKWWDAWTNIDRCPEYDFLWLSLFCRARKMTTKYDWTSIRKRLLTLSQYWLRLPIGGGSLDKSFPRAGNPRHRSFPSRLKPFIGSVSSYNEGVQLVTKVCKLLVASIGGGAGNGTSEGTKDVLRFFAFVAPYFNPSNIGQWTFALGACLHNFSYEFCCRVGAIAGHEVLMKTHPQAVEAFGRVQQFYQTTIPHAEIAMIIDAMLPLCKQALYSKSGHVSQAGEAAMVYFAQIDPQHVTPSFLDFASRALDISAVNLSHQAPAALSVLARLVQPSLRTNPGILFSRLPDILALTLAGIDSNDRGKTIRTLIFYRSLTSWVPVSSYVELGTDEQTDGTEKGTTTISSDLFESASRWRNSKQYADAIDGLPPNSPLHQAPGVSTTLESIDDVSSVMKDWTLELLERIFGLLRSSGEVEKATKRISGVSKHSSADVLQARNFVRVLKECMLQVFVSMDDDTFGFALKRLVRFIDEETLPTAGKEASCLCQAAAAIREGGHSPGLDALVPLLTDDISHQSTKTTVYRVRCLSGAVRSAGPCLLKHRKAISQTIDTCLMSEDKFILKAGCKLLRHTIATCAESYPLAFDAKPRYFRTPDSAVTIGRSSQIKNDPIKWHVPEDEHHRFAVDIYQKHLVSELDAMIAPKDGDNVDFLERASDATRIRKLLRVMRYCLRGGSSLLLDLQAIDDVGDDFVPYERASYHLLSHPNREALKGLRTKMCGFISALSSVISADTFFPKEIDSLESNHPKRMLLASIGGDNKICNEVCDIATLLLTRRGAGFRSQEARVVWKAQRQLTSDYFLSATSDQISEVLQCTIHGNSHSFLYNDGEDSGKSIPRRLLQTKLKIFHDFLQRSASFEVPRRLKRHLALVKGQSKSFMHGESMISFLEPAQDTVRRVSSPMCAYERLTDSLYALSCHPNPQVRSSAVNVVDYSSTRFGWLVAARIPRLLSALALDDLDSRGQFGVPSCSKLSQFKDPIGKRKLADSLKGICSILSLSRHMKHMLQSENFRYQLVKTLFSAEKVIVMLPGEEMQKFVHYLHALFSGFRSKFYFFPRVSESDANKHDATIRLSLATLSEASISEDNEQTSDLPHWRKKLLSCWVLLTYLDEQSHSGYSSEFVYDLWETCFRTLETESGQPLQRLALGFLGRLIQLPKKLSHQVIQQRLASKDFCNSLGEALVYDHKEDNSVGSGQDSQWAFGIEDYIRDAARNIAPRTLFPFPRTSQAFGSFKSSHSQLIGALLQQIGRDDALLTVEHLLAYAKGCSEAPPSEDFRNQQATGAEIYAAVARFMLESKPPGQSVEYIWTSLLIPYFEDVVIRTPFSLSGAYFDSIRYSLQFLPPATYLPMTTWLGTKIQGSLWQLSKKIETNALEENGTPVSNDGFTTQSKWLYLFSAVLIEMSESIASRTQWYHAHLCSGLSLCSASTDLVSWKYITSTVLPLVFGALSHPFDSCRDHVARVLFRLAYESSRRQQLEADLSVVDYFRLLEDDNSDASPLHRLNGLSTMRRFVSYCVHLGESKFEYSMFVIQLLPMAFSAIGSSFAADENTSEDQVALRAIETDVIKTCKSLLAEVSVTCVVSYGKLADIVHVMNLLEESGKSTHWQVRHATAHFLRCFQSVHQFVFSPEMTIRSLELVASMLSDERREVSSAAMAALTGVLATAPIDDVKELVAKYCGVAEKSKLRRMKKKPTIETLEATPATNKHGNELTAKDAERALNQKTSVFFLCAAIMAHPYETPSYVPAALAAISKHSFERNAPLSVREVVKRCCAEYKKTHMSDDWDRHRKVFSPEELEALEDVVSSPHYYA